MRDDGDGEVVGVFGRLPDGSSNPTMARRRLITYRLGKSLLEIVVAGIRFSALSPSQRGHLLHALSGSNFSSLARYRDKRAPLLSRRRAYNFAIS
jgi:hypothetical protein